MSHASANTIPVDDNDDLAGIILDQAERLFSSLQKEKRPSDTDQAWSDQTWIAIDEAGFSNALIPEEAGGVGLDGVTSALLLRRAAYHAVSLPLAESMIGAHLWFSTAQQSVSGPIAIAPFDETNAAPLTISDKKEGVFLNGTASRVACGEQAKWLLAECTNDAGEQSIVLIPAQQAVTQRHRNLADEPRATMTFDKTAVERDRVRRLARDADLNVSTLTIYGAYVRAQQIVGAMEHCLEHAVAYANERQQFGQAIGRFQAVRQMMAEAAGHFAAATAAADLAASAWGRPTFALASALAKARCGEAAGRVAEITHQVHGAMGFTREHPLHLSTRRLWAWRDEFGSDAFWQERIGRLVCRQGGDALWPTLMKLQKQKA